ncbi:granule-bound starch synthase 1, chloroplastic/amyloplastic-like [Camellia sinensis]|uniref:granule-bound starch synthase 1, chloroplastic/amyloplastic-like n=1 Tax=Camellia sinensis TaxID=4442 RepID=UPI0010355B36|nr:granule-bound starch synthase 1, chloroplastic/amyloplastic-like [Camellia sinensis]
MGQIGLKRQTMTHNGLRSLNKLDMLQMKKNAKAIAKHASNKNGPKTENDRPSSAIIYGSGMNIVFVGAEVGPWSKTGGLGDVLGGLPPAMAGKGHRVMTVSPRYDQYKDAWDTHLKYSSLLFSWLSDVLTA